MKQGLRIVKETRLDINPSQTIKPQQQQININKLLKPTLKYRQDPDKSAKISKEKFSKPLGNDSGKNSRTKLSKTKAPGLLIPKNSKGLYHIPEVGCQLDEKIGDQP